MLHFNLNSYSSAAPIFYRSSQQPMCIFPQTVPQQVQLGQSLFVPTQFVNPVGNNNNAANRKLCDLFTFYSCYLLLLLNVTKSVFVECLILLTFKFFFSTVLYAWNFFHQLELKCDIFYECIL